VTSARVQVAWTVTSDARWKSDITPLAYGYDFIAGLKPVSYVRNGAEDKGREYGFIAQDVDALFKSLGDTTEGMLTQDGNGYYELRYNDFFAIIVRAIQELGARGTTLADENTALTERVSSLEAENATLRARLDRLESLVGVSQQ